MAFLCYLPFFISLYVIVFYSLETAFLSVYLPCLLFFPQVFDTDVRGFVNVTLSEAAIIPIFVAYLIHKGPRLSFSVTGFLVVAFIAWGVISDYVTCGFSQARYTFIHDGLSALCPFVVARGVIESRNLRVKFLKRVVFLLFLTWIDMLHSLFLGWSLYARIGRYLLLGVEPGVWFMRRFGLPRLPYAFGHPILAGLMIGIGYHLHRWLTWNKLWEKRFKNWHPVEIAKATIIRWELLLALFLTASRGPWIGTLVGAIVGGATLSKTPRASFLIRVVLCFVGMYVGWFVLNALTEIYGNDVWMQAVVYRKNLYAWYAPAIEQKPIFGWGAIEWPVGGVQSSVDNYFLYLTVLRGWPGSILMGLLLLVTSGKLFLRALVEPATADPQKYGVTITMFAVCVTVIVTVGTVWMDPQAFSFFMIFTGWCQGYLKKKTLHHKSLDINLEECRLSSPNLMQS